MPHTDQTRKYSSDRYIVHPVRVMYQDRLWVALGSGQFLNEHVTNEYWPVKTEGNERLKEAVHIIRNLLKGERVSFEGKCFQIYDTKLYTLPSVMPKLLVAALSNESAHDLASCSDRIITVVKPAKDQKEFIYAYQQGGGISAICICRPSCHMPKTRSRLNRKPGKTGGMRCWEESCSRKSDFDSAVELVTPEQVKEIIRISSDPKEHPEWLQEDISCGFSQIYIKDVSHNQAGTIEMYGKILKNIDA